MKVKVRKHKESPATVAKEQSCLYVDRGYDTMCMLKAQAKAAHFKKLLR